jgi:putative phosphonate metabolism protein
LSARYAIYLVPSEEHSLYDIGQQLLGRDAHLCGPLPQPALDGVSAERLAAITETTRHYGFHATLKPPFRIAEHQSVEALHEQAERFAAARRPFIIPALEVTALDRFIAVRPSQTCSALHELADDCIRSFDSFRAPPDTEEQAKRQAASLTEAQNKLLEQWGYPYVFEEYRPHFSITERIEEASARDKTAKAIRKFCSPESLTCLTVESISIFGQPDSTMPFYQTARFQFGE